MRQTLSRMSRAHGPIRASLPRVVSARWSSSKPKAAVVRHEVLVLGGGAAGQAISHALTGQEKDIAVVEPSTTHHYQPGWTMGGAGAMTAEQLARPMQSVMSPSVSWIRDSVTSLSPDENRVTLSTGQEVEYGTLFVTVGIETKWDAIPGLREALGSNNVCSNYSAEHYTYTNEAMRAFKGGKAIFSHPASPIKCPGGTQKVMWIADDFWRKAGVTTDVTFYTALPLIFGVPYYAKALQKLADERDIHVFTKHDVVQVRGNDKQVVVRNMETEEESVQDFDFLHVSPKMGPFAWLKPIADASGFVEVDPSTLQHPKYSNVYAIGDVAGTLNAKTAGAVSSQVGVILDNLGAHRRGTEGPSKYAGYGSCPLMTGHGRGAFIEFEYGGVPAESMGRIMDQRKETPFWWYVKKDVLPRMYWDGLVKGKWLGPSKTFPFTVTRRVGELPE